MPESDLSSGVVIRALNESDQKAWVAARCRLWADCSPEQAAAEVVRILDDDDQLAIGAFDRETFVGFAEYSLHPHAIGCTTGPVAYLEAWWVADSHRRVGVGRMSMRSEPSSFKSTTLSKMRSTYFGSP